MFEIMYGSVGKPEVIELDSHYLEMLTSEHLEKQRNR